MDNLSSYISPPQVDFPVSIPWSYRLHKDLIYTKFSRGLTSVSKYVYSQTNPHFLASAALSSISSKSTVIIPNLLSKSTCVEIIKEGEPVQEICQDEDCEPEFTFRIPGQFPEDEDEEEVEHVDTVQQVQLKVQELHIRPITPPLCLSSFPTPKARQQPQIDQHFHRVVYWSCGHRDSHFVYDLDSNTGRCQCPRRDQLVHKPGRNPAFKLRVVEGYCPYCCLVGDLEAGE